MQIANGNTYARDRLILIHMRIVLKIALSMSKQYQLNIEDAVSAGFIGLITAVGRFDPNGFSAFQSYASLWIQQNIQRECNPIWTEYYFPAHYKEKMLPAYQKYKQHYCASCVDNDICINLLNEIAEFGDITIEQAEEYLDAALVQVNGKQSIEQLAELEDDEKADNPRYGLYIDDHSLFDIICRRLLKDAIDKILNSLTEREEKVIRLRYGLDSSDTMTLEEVGKLFGVTRERIRQIESKAIRKLRHPLILKKLNAYCN